MANNAYLRAAMVQAGMELTPPLIQSSLLEDSQFQDEFGIKADAVLSFDDTGVSVRRSDLFDSVRKVLAGVTDEKVADTDGNDWKLKNISEEGELPQLALSCNKQRIILPNFAALSPDRNIRIKSLIESASDVNLPSSAQIAWQEVLSERALSDDEVDIFHSEFRKTPAHISRFVRSEIENGLSKIATLVPPSRIYFERLVGAYDGSDSIAIYATGTGRNFLKELTAWSPYDGFLFGILLSSHSAIPAEIDITKLSTDDLVNAFEYLEKDGDRISQIGAIEVGFRVLQSRPEINPTLIRLIQKIRDDDADGKASGFKLLSALFVFVDGELARLRLLTDDPPFYRRLSALSQASLIHRQLLKVGVDIDEFCDWAFSNRGQFFYMQSLTDMRVEPRWDPEYVKPSQIKADFLGRIMNAAKNAEAHIEDNALYELALGNKQGSISSVSDSISPYFPGPLEGTEGKQIDPPTELSETVEKQLRTEEIGPSSFIALVNSALLFRIGADHAELAAKALKLASYRLPKIDDRVQLVTILYGLATVAAKSRSHNLADELRILARRYKNDTQYALTIEESVRICLVASASREDMFEWREFLGEWLNELAFSEMENREGEALLSQLRTLCHIIPELWVSCGRADAALMAFKQAEAHHDGI